LALLVFFLICALPPDALNHFGLTLNVLSSGFLYEPILLSDRKSIIHSDFIYCFPLVHYSTRKENTFSYSFFIRYDDFVFVIFGANLFLSNNFTQRFTKTNVLVLY